jgi:hypothetical protein
VARSPVSEHLPPVPPPIGQRRSNAGPRGAQADLLRRVHEIFGPLPVIDASEPLIPRPLPLPDLALRDIFTVRLQAIEARLDLTWVAVQTIQVAVAQFPKTIERPTKRAV